MQTPCPQCQAPIPVTGERGQCPACQLAVNFVDAPECSCGKAHTGNEVWRCECGIVNHRSGRQVDLVATCPRCARDVAATGQELRCNRCQTTFQVRDGF